MADNTNPGNFANRPKEEVQNIASKGGQSNHSGGFASMDPDKQVSFPVSQIMIILTINGNKEGNCVYGWTSFKRLIRAWERKGEGGRS